MRRADGPEHRVNRVLLSAHDALRTTTRLWNASPSLNSGHPDPSGFNARSVLTLSSRPRQVLGR